MSGASVIKEFLVGLGFKIDEKSFKKFDDGLKAASKAAGVMAATADAAAVVVNVAVTKMADRLEDLYWASQRVHSSAGSIKAFDYAVAQMGGTADQARASLEGLASFMRSNPAAERFIGAMGVQTRSANGELRDTAEIMGDLATKLRAMPFWRAKAYAGMFGIDERTLQAMIRGTDQFGAHYRDMLRDSGVDMEKAAEAGYFFKARLRDLVAQLEITAYRLAIWLMPIVEKGIRLFKELDKRTGGLSTTIMGLVAILGPLLLILDPIVVAVLALSAGVVALVADFDRWKQGLDSFIDWGEWADDIDAVTAALEPLGEALGELWALIVDVAKWLAEKFGPAARELAHGALRDLANGINTVADAIKLVVHLLRGEWSQAWKDADKLGSDIAKGLADRANSRLRAGVDIWRAFRGEEPLASPAASGPSAQARAAGERARQVSSDVQKRVVDFFMSKGWSRAQAIGLASNLQTESSFNHKAVGDGGKAYGLAQWHPDRQAAFKRWLGRDIRTSSFEDQLAFVHYELTQGAERLAGRALRNATGAGQAAQVVSRMYERPLDVAGEMAKRGALAEAMFRNSSLGSSGRGTTVTLHQKTDIHVAGSGAGTAREVADAQDRVNGDMVRNLMGALV